MIKKNILFTFIIMFISLTSFAGVPELISKQLEKKINRIEKNLKKWSSDQLNQKKYIYNTADGTAHYLKRIRLQYSPFVAFDLSFFELKVAPLFELRWTRKTPKGWEIIRSGEKSAQR